MAVRLGSNTNAQATRWSRWLPLVVIALSGCHREAPPGITQLPPSQTKPIRQVEIALVQERELDYNVETVGTLEPERQTSVASGVTGVVDEVLFREGDVVSPEKSVLIKIDQKKFEAQAALARANVVKAQANVTSAEDAARRAEKLVSRKALTAEELVVAKQNLEVAKAELLAAQADERLSLLNLEKSRVRPPYGGQMNERLVAAGDFVKEDTVIGTIADLSTMRLSTFIPELAAPRVAPGDMLSFTMEALPQKSFQAKISYISTVADPQTHMFAVKGEIPQPDPRMKPGMFARIKVVVERHSKALVVPEESVRTGEQGFVVFVPTDRPGKDGQMRKVATARKIKPGLRRPGIVEVLSGLKSSELVVTRGAEALEDGMAIEFPSLSGASLPPVSTVEK